MQWWRTEQEPSAHNQNKMEHVEEKPKISNQQWIMGYETK